MNLQAKEAKYQWWIDACGGWKGSSIRKVHPNRFVNICVVVMFRSITLWFLSAGVVFVGWIGSWHWLIEIGMGMWFITALVILLFGILFGLIPYDENFG